MTSGDQRPLPLLCGQRGSSPSALGGALISTVAGLAALQPSLGCSLACCTEAALRRAALACCRLKVFPAARRRRRWRRYQPHHDILVSTSWGAPNAFFKGFNPAEVPDK
jgi:hypothetical protein